jgi:hypothetical protein
MFFHRHFGKGPFGLSVNGHHIRPSIRAGGAHMTARSFGVVLPAGLGYIGGSLPRKRRSSRRLARKRQRLIRKAIRKATR